MKKLFVSFAVLAAMCMASCSSSDNNAEGEATEEEAVEAVEGVEEAQEAPEVESSEVVTLSQQAASCSTLEDAQKLVVDVKNNVNKLIHEGRVEEAKAYLNAVAPSISAKYPELSSKLDKIGQVISAASSETVDGAKDAAKQVAESAANDAKAKADEAVQNAKDKANEKTNAAVNEAANKVKDKLKL